LLERDTSRGDIVDVTKMSDKKIIDTVLTRVDQFQTVAFDHTTQLILFSKDHGAEWMFSQAIRGVCKHPDLHKDLTDPDKVITLFNEQFRKIKERTSRTYNISSTSWLVGASSSQFNTVREALLKALCDSPDNKRVYIEMVCYYDGARTIEVK